MVVGEIGDHSIMGEGSDISSLHCNTVQTHPTLPPFILTEYSHLQ